MPDVTIYYNARCATCRRALALLRKKGIVPRVVAYLKTPPTEEELDHLLRLLRMEPRGILRTQEKEYRLLRLDRPGRSRRELIRAMIEHPILIQRPIVIAKGKAIVARPPEKVEQIL